MHRPQERPDSKEARRIIVNQMLNLLLSPNEEHGLLQNLASSYDPRSSAKGVGAAGVDKFCRTSGVMSTSFLFVPAAMVCLVHASYLVSRLLCAQQRPSRSLTLTAEAALNVSRWADEIHSTQSKHWHYLKKDTQPRSSFSSTLLFCVD